MIPGLIIYPPPAVLPFYPGPRIYPVLPKGKPGRKSTTPHTTVTDDSGERVTEKGANDDLDGRKDADIK